MASLRVQIRQKAASCRPDVPLPFQHVPAPVPNTAFASERQLSRGRITSHRSRLSPSSPATEQYVAAMAEVKPLQRRSGGKAGLPVRHTIISGSGERTGKQHAPGQPACPANALRRLSDANASGN